MSSQTHTATVEGQEHGIVYIRYGAEVYAVDYDGIVADCEKAVELGYARDRDDADQRFLENFSPDLDCVIGRVHMAGGKGFSTYAGPDGERYTVPE